MSKMWKNIIISILAVTVVCLIIYFVIPKEEKEKNVNNTVKEEPIIEEGQVQYSLINMENIENAKVENGKKINTSEKLLSEKEFEGMKIKDIKLIAENGTSSFTATVENNSGKKFDAKKITIVFKDKDGNEYAKLNTYLGDIAIGKNTSINASTTSDIVNAYDFIIEASK